MNDPQKNKITKQPGLVFGPFVLLIAINLTAGCIELGLFSPIGESGTSIIDGTNPAAPDGTTPPLRVALSASNPTPQNNEEVTLRCQVIRGSDTGVLFSFAASPQPATGLSVNPTTGRATFIVTDSDVNLSFRFTCSATTDAGENATSSVQLVTPTGM